MSQLTSMIRGFLLPESPITRRLSLASPGLYHFHRQVGNDHVRYHLRVDEGEPCVLIAAASEALFLSRVGATAAKALLEGHSSSQVARSLPFANAGQIVADVSHALADLGQPGARYPVFNLADTRVASPAWRLSAPFQADVDVAPTRKAFLILDQLWTARIPHVRFVVTPRTDRRGLVRLVEAAEDIGMIAGVRVPSVRWLNGGTLDSLASAGLDYIVLPWGIVADRHDHYFGRGDFKLFRGVVSRIREWEMTPVVITCLLPVETEALPEGLDALNSAGIHHAEVAAIAESATPLPGLPANRLVSGPQDVVSNSETELESRGFYAMELRQLASWIEDLADNRRMQLVWLPTLGRQGDEPLRDVVRRGPRCGGDVSIRIDAEGNIVPPRGPSRSVGNLLSDDWGDIWSDPAFARFRGVTISMTRCRECPGLTVCAVNCPADSISWVLG